MRGPGGVSSDMLTVAAATQQEVGSHRLTIVITISTVLALTAAGSRTSGTCRRTLVSVVSFIIRFHICGTVLKAFQLAHRVR